jgi:NTE family protein
VAASCAIPGFYRSVRIGGRRYVDGGVQSTSNLDLMAGLGLDLVICLNPTPRFTRAPRARSVSGSRSRCARRLDGGCMRRPRGYGRRAARSS